MIRCLRAAVACNSTDASYCPCLQPSAVKENASRMLLPQVKAAGQAQPCRRVDSSSDCRHCSAMIRCLRAAACHKGLYSLHFIKCGGMVLSLTEACAVQSALQIRVNSCESDCNQRFTWLLVSWQGLHSTDAFCLSMLTAFCCGKRQQDLITGSQGCRMGSAL